jgi:hypothetical protein
MPTQKKKMTLLNKAILFFALSFFFAPLLLYAIYLLVQHFKIKKQVAVIQMRYNEVKRKIAALGLKPNQHFSSFSHPYVEYRNDFHAVDNLHMEFDDSQQKLVCYMLEPSFFKVYDYVSIKTVTIKVFNEGEYISSIAVIVKFYDGKEALLSVNDNIQCSFGDSIYTKAMEDANKLLGIIKSKSSDTVKGD